MRGLADCAKRLAKGTVELARLGEPPWFATLNIELAADPRTTFSGPNEQAPLGAAAGRIAAKIIALAPPGVPTLVLGQRITEAHVAWLAAKRDCGALFLDPIDPSERTIRVALAGLAE